MGQPGTSGHEVDEGSSLLSQHEQHEAILSDPGSSPAANGAAPSPSSGAPLPLANTTQLRQMLKRPAENSAQCFAVSSSSPGPAPVALMDLLGGDDLQGGLGGLSLNGPTSAPPALQLRQGPVLAPADFQAKWGALQPASRFTHPLQPGALALIQPTSQQVGPSCFYSLLADGKHALCSGVLQTWVRC